MKKFYFLLVAMLVSLAANAEGFYFNGNGSWTSWTESAMAANKFKATETAGVYTLDVASLSGDFLIVEFAAGQTSINWAKKITPKGGQSACKVGEAVAYQQLDGGSNWKFPETIANCVLTLDTNAKTLTAAGKSVANEFTVVYLVGDFGGSWDETNTDKPLNATGAANTYEGKYTLTAANSYIKPKAGAQVLGATGSDLVPEMGRPYNLTAGGDKAIKLTAGTYTFTVVADQKAETGVITITKDGGDDPEPPTPGNDFTGWYVNCPGEFNSWADNGIAVPESGIVNFEELPIGTGEFEIKIWDGKADSYYANGEALVLGQEYTIGDGQGSHMTVAGATEGQKFNVSFDCNTNVIVVTSAGGDDPEPPVPPVDNNTYCLHGQIAGDANWADIPMTKSDAGNWEWTGKCVAGEFGIKKNGNWMTGGAMNITEADKAYTVAATGANSKSTLEGNYTVSFNPTAMTLTFITYGGVIDETVTYAVRGDLATEGSWNDFAMTETDGIWTVTAEVMNTGANFGIKKMINGVQPNEGGWFSGEDSNYTIANNGTYATTDFGGTNFKFDLTAATNVTFQFNPETKELTITGLSGVEVVEAEEAAAEYFNLQGVRVANPTEGLYIVRKGNKVSKVVL